MQENLAELASPALISLERYEGALLHHNTTFGRTHEVKIGRSEAFPELVRLGPQATQELLVPYLTGRATRLTVYGETLQTYVPKPMISGLTPVEATGWAPPAIGDLTADGSIELVFTGDWEWQAFRANGTMIARYTVIDKYDQGSDSAAVVVENGQAYLYLVTRNVPVVTGEEMVKEDIRKRLHKLRLEPQPLGVVPSPPVLPLSGNPVAVPGLNDPALPFGFSHVWIREFPTAGTGPEMFFYDLTGDGQEEIILQQTGFLHPEGVAFSIISREGEILYGHELNGSGFISIGDVDGDGRDEVVALLAVQELDDPMHYWEPWSDIVGIQWDGASFQQKYHFRADNEYGGNQLNLCDVNGDGHAEILVHGHDLYADVGQNRLKGKGKVQLIDYTGAVLWDYRFFYGQPTHMLIDDFTGDGRYEIVVATLNGQIFVFSSALQPALDDYEQVFASYVEFGWITQEELGQLRTQVASLGLDWRQPEAAAWDPVDYLMAPDEAGPGRGSSPAPTAVLGFLLAVCVALLAGRKLREEKA